MQISYPQCRYCGPPGNLLYIHRHLMCRCMQNFDWSLNIVEDHSKVRQVCGLLYWIIKFVNLKIVRRILTCEKHILNYACILFIFNINTIDNIYLSKKNYRCNTSIFKNLLLVVRAIQASRQFKHLANHVKLRSFIKCAPIRYLNIPGKQELKC